MPHSPILTMEALREAAFAVALPSARKVLEEWDVPSPQDTATHGRIAEATPARAIVLVVMSRAVRRAYPPPRATRRATRPRPSRQPSSPRLSRSSRLSPCLRSQAPGTRLFRDMLTCLLLPYLAARNDGAEDPSAKVALGWLPDKDATLEYALSRACTVFPSGGVPWLHARTIADIAAARDVVMELYASGARRVCAGGVPRHAHTHHSTRSRVAPGAQARLPPTPTPPYCNPPRPASLPRRSPAGRDSRSAGRDGHGRRAHG